jgi:uncharacterized membrane protein YphA (DoxX/SURF4 family)
MHIAQIVLSIPLAALFLGTGLAKLAGAKVSRTDAERFGYPYSRYRILGALEAAAAAGLLVGLFAPAVAATTAAGLVLLMIGAFFTHLRAKDPVAKAIPAAVIGLLAAAVIPLALT